MMRPSPAAAGLLAMLVMPIVVTGAVADPDQAARLASMCASCHRLDPQADTASPPIAGLGPERFKSVMKSFRTDERPNHIMHAVSTALSDDEIAVLADYFAKQATEGKRP